jgi:hypothetical protein
MPPSRSSRFQLPTPSKAELRHRADLYRRLAAAALDEDKAARLKELALRWEADAEVMADD